MKRPASATRALVSLLALAMIAPALSGCIGLAAQLMNVIYGNNTSAEYNGLKGKKVAVVCVSSGSAFGPDATSDELARAVGGLLRQNVKEIQVIPHEKIQEWADNHEWSQSDYLEIGRGVKAETVVAIDVQSMSLQDGQTLYKGRAFVVVSVFDVASGAQDFQREFDNLAYPINSVHHVHDMPKHRFRRLFIAHIAQRVGQLFYEHPFAGGFAQDQPAF